MDEYEKCRHCHTYCSGECDEEVRTVRVMNDYYYAGGREFPYQHIAEQCEDCGGGIKLSESDDYYECVGSAGMQDEMDVTDPCGKTYPIVKHPAYDTIY